ncbi:unnamed protein product [Angiostrongylus costaricensis]|uniref:SSD domain-containing protein n=1 Tax=Angiostrongylus costaricensis TaxID=334426 RepID=A0A0R3PQX3_ANGCS|nr:unnamed protein product [Angiostrongylus costaricensis]
MSACVCPLLATSSALGFLFWCGFRFGSILCVTPFLVLAIGVDDAFLMMQSLMHISNSDRKMSKRERVANMLVDVGPSVTITSMTNVMAFLVGYFTPTPEIQLFCIGNAIAILFDFIYQVTMFAAILSVTSDLHTRNRPLAIVNKQWRELESEKPGNLNDPKRLAEVNKLIERFESFPECLGSNFSHYFVRDYKLFNEMVEFDDETSFGMDVAASNRSDAFSRSAMQPFFSWPEFRHWNGFVKFDEHGR